MSKTARQKFVAHKSDYFDDQRPVHRISYCAFLDVLGFSERVSNSYKDGTANELLQNFHRILSKSISSLNESVGESMLYFKSFTDNVVLAHPQYSEDMESEFAFILWAVTEYQFQMALNGFFIRGGLAVGQLFIDQNSVYGEALLEAYQLESKTAVNPIVVLSDKTMKLVDTHVGYYLGGNAPQRRSVLKGPDGRYFLNYLTECIVEGTKKNISIQNHLTRTSGKLSERLKLTPRYRRFLRSFRGSPPIITTFVMESRLCEIMTKI